MVAPLPGPPGGSPSTGDPTKVMGRRVLAALIDGLLVVVPTVVIALGGIEYLEVSSLDRPPDVYCEDYMDRFDGLCVDASDVDERVYLVDEVEPAGSAVGWGLSLGLLVLLQGLAGWTPGKLVTGIRTVREDGRRPGILRAFLRWLLWLVDGFPLYVVPLVGLITAGTTQGHRRVGDMAAGTYVVRASAAGSPVRLPGAFDASLGEPMTAASWPSDTWVPPIAPGGTGAWNPPPPPTPGGWAAPGAPATGAPPTSTTPASPSPSPAAEPPAAPAEDVWMAADIEPEDRAAGPEPEERAADIEPEDRAAGPEPEERAADIEPEDRAPGPEPAPAPAIAPEPDTGEATPESEPQTAPAAEPVAPLEPAVTPEPEATLESDTAEEPSAEAAAPEPAAEAAASAEPQAAPEPEVAPAPEAPATEPQPEPAPATAQTARPAASPPMPPPQWDESRGTYIQWDPARAKWLQWDERSRTWFVIPGQ